MSEPPSRSDATYCEVMRIFLACLLVAGCGARIPPAQSTVTIRAQRHVTLTADGPDAAQVQECSDACRDEECTARCPTAAVGVGACPEPDSAHAFCRTFASTYAYERPGSCDDAAHIRGVIVCEDNRGEREAARRDNDHAGKVLDAILAVPLLIVIIAAAGQRT